MTDPTVHVQILAQIGHEQYELGEADVTQDGRERDVAALMRRIADELEVARDA
jgi:hypothetical protein